jgi:hypothetical protein
LPPFVVRDQPKLALGVVSMSRIEDTIVIVVLAGTFLWTYVFLPLVFFHS